MMRHLFLCIALVSGCSAADERAESSVVTQAPDELSLHAIDWNSAKNDVGSIATIVEDDEELVLFGSKGATTMAGGAVRLVIPGPKVWSDAATIPAADRIGDWTVGVADSGKVLRVNGDVLEDVSARWGLSTDKVRTVIGIDKTSVAFGFEGGLAIADGKTVTRYDGPKSGALAGGGGKLAWIGDPPQAGPVSGGGDVKLFTLADRKVRSFPVPGASSIAIDPTGRVLVAADRTLWISRGTELLQRFVADAPLGNLTPAGGRVWFTVGSELAVLTADSISISKGAGLSTDARLRGTAKGDVWVLSSTAVRKFGGSAPSEVLADWQATAQPVYARVCSSCHAPGGTAGSDLSTLEGWKQHRDAIGKRVLVDKTMPPKGTTLTDDDLAAVKAWLSRN